MSSFSSVHDGKTEARLWKGPPKITHQGGDEGAGTQELNGQVRPFSLTYYCNLGFSLPSFLKLQPLAQCWVTRWDERPSLLMV